MRKLLYACLSLSLMLSAACQGPEAPNPDEVAARTAKIYYDYLLHGNYEAYVDGFHQPDSIPASYRSQIVLSAKQYAYQMQEDHGGLKSVGIAKAKTDTAHHVGHVYLVLNFKDSTHEEIVVPMVLHRGHWMMK